MSKSIIKSLHGNEDEMREKMKHWTDYPFTELGDIAYQEAPVREVEVLNYDGDKYCDIKICGQVFSIKAGYIYTAKGRLGEVDVISWETLRKLEATPTERTPNG